MVDLNWADWMIFAIMTISCAFGLKRGLIKEVLSIASWVLALIVAVGFKDHLSFFLEDMISTTSLREVVAFIGLFFATLFVGSLIGYIVGAFIKASGISTVDRLLGLFFGLLRGCIVVMAILLLVPAVVSIDQDQWWADSLIIPNFLEFEDWAKLASSEVKFWAVQSIDS